MPAECQKLAFAVNHGRAENEVPNGPYPDACWPAQTCRDRSSDSTSFSKAWRLKGKVLIGRGVGADALTPLVKGLKVRVRARLSIPVQMALSGGVALLKAGEVVPTDDQARHPRTAIGIDRDNQIVHLVVVDGRSESSSGYTLVQLATLMKELGDDTAMNMDGGGSSEMVALSANGVLGVRNVPSDGRERLVANGLGIFFRP